MSFTERLGGLLTLVEQRETLRFEQRTEDIRQRAERESLRSTLLTYLGEIKNALEEQDIIPELQETFIRALLLRLMSSLCKRPQYVGLEAIQLSETEVGLKDGTIQPIDQVVGQCLSLEELKQILNS